MISNSKYKVGATFCGGCNPFFDRANLYKTIVTKFENSCEFVRYEENENYDIILIINGCSSECLMENNYKSNIIVINSTNFGNVIEAFQKNLLKI